MQKQERQDKLHKIISFLNGSLSFDALRPPKHYVAFVTNGIYDIDDLKLNESEFNEWHKLNVRDIDTVTIFKEQLSHPVKAIGCNDTIFLIPKNDRDRLPVRIVDKSALPFKPKPIEQPSKPDLVIEHRFKGVPAKEPKKKEEVKKKAPSIVERIIEPVMATSGLMSEYGETWEVADRSIYKNSRYP